MMPGWWLPIWRAAVDRLPAEKLIALAVGNELRRIVLDHEANQGRETDRFLRPGTRN